MTGFTSMSKAVPPAEVMNLLNSLFTVFDELAAEFSVSGVKMSCHSYGWDTVGR